MYTSTVRFSILGILLASCAFSVNDISIKYFTELMPLHQVVFFRAIIALIFTFFLLLPFEGGCSALKTNRPILHIASGTCLVIANLSFFSGLSLISLAESSAIFFVAPLLITIFSVVFLKESVGFRRWLALVLGMTGVLLVIKPGSINFTWATCLPIIAATMYAIRNIVTRKMGLSEKAGTMSLYLHLTFIVACGFMGLAFGDGKFSGSQNAALEFLFRAWVSPSIDMVVIIFIAGVSSALGGYFSAQAYRYSSASVVAPFEYMTLVLAVFWGYMLWNEFPDVFSIIGIFLIIFSGVSIAIREGQIKIQSSAKYLGGRR
ncbi:MAG: DMT family transporter [Pseudomonadota bacterium]|nr:DMT family transporter [Pseudomonadota bacterium]